MSSFVAMDRARAVERGQAEHPALQVLVELLVLRCRRRIAWLEQLPHDARALGMDSPERERSFYAAQGGTIAAQIDALEARLVEAENPLGRLVRVFGLSPAEFHLLLACVGLELEPALGGLYARLNGQPDRGYVTAPMVARLFEHGHGLPYNQSGPLVTWGLVHTVNLGPGLASPVIADPQVLACIRDRLSLDGELVGVSEVIEPPEPLGSWPMAAALARIERSLAAEQPTRIILVGPPHVGRRSFAACLLGRLGAGALAVDTEEIDDERWTEQYVRVVRLGAMAGLIPVWHGNRLDRRWPRQVSPGVLQIIACEDPRSIRPLHGAVDHLIFMPSPELDERLASWKSLVPICASWPAGSVDRLAARHRLAIGDIAEIGRRMPADLEEATLMARQQTRGNLGELGTLLNCPFDWNDLVVGDDFRDSLEEFAFEAAERVRFWEGAGAKRLFPRGTGLVGLLAGPPGTGKTMAAQVIAADLELDLFRINLAAVVSKYIGETAKNLDKVFSRATRMNAVLLFDEADALFSKRTDVKDSHDRYANTDTNYLLQLLEDYQGLALLATNKKNNIDPAFVRRIRYVFEFRRPDVAQRRTIWRRVLGELLGADLLRGLETTIAVLAEVVELSGAQIKNAVLAAVFVARRRRRAVGVEELLRGIDRELGKEGRGLSDRERERLRRHA
jgi:hypothetical protein